LGAAEFAPFGLTEAQSFGELPGDIVKNAAIGAGFGTAGALISKGFQGARNALEPRGVPESPIPQAQPVNAPAQAPVQAPDMLQTLNRFRIKPDQRTPGTSIPVYRGQVAEGTAREANISRPQGLMNVINQEAKPGVTPVEMSFYTESKDVAKNVYADQDVNIISQLTADHGEAKANQLFETLYGRKPITGTVKKFNINPKKTLDLTDVGETPSVNTLVNKLLEAEGSPIPKGTNVNAPEWKRYNELERLVANKVDEMTDTLPAYRLLRNNGPQDTSATQFVDWLKKNGYDTVKYAENNTNHYATMNVAKPQIPRGEVKLKPRATKVATTPTERSVSAQIEHPTGIKTETLTLKDVPAVGDTKFWNSAKKETKYKGTVEELQAEVEAGTLDTSKVSPLLKMNLQRFAETAPLRREPVIPGGLKERGVSANIRTDTARPDELRDTFSTDPLVYQQAGNAESLAKAQAVFDKGLEPAISELDGLIKELKPEAAPLVKMLADKLTAEGNIVRARELLSNAAVRATEAGQYGQAFRILRDADSTTLLQTLEKQLKDLNKKGLEAYGKNWKNADLTQAELDTISRLPKGDEQAFVDALEKIQMRLANEMPASTMEKINAWRHMAMLLNPKTHIRNWIGNAIMKGMRKSAQRVSGVLQKTLPKESRTQAVLVKKEYKDLAQQYFESNKKELLGGANKYREGVVLGMQDKRVFRKSRVAEKFGKDVDVLESLRKFNYDLLQRSDNPFFRNAYADRLASYAQSKGIKDFSKLSEKAFDTARLEAEQATYKDASRISTYINDVKRAGTGTGATPGAKTKALVAEAALPFTKTPVNIIKRGVQYSPAGLISGLASVKSAKGAAAAIDEMAKGLTGTAVLGLGYLLASKGILTGKAEKDVDLREYNKSTGQYPFSVLGKFSYDWAQPFAVPLSVGVEIFNAVKDSPEDAAKMNALVEGQDDAKIIDIAKRLLGGMQDSLEASGDTIFNMSIMRGVKTLLGGGTKSFMEGMAELPKGYATQFVPTLANQFAGILDPTVREAYVKGDLGSSFKNALTSRIPGLSSALQPKQTPFGEDVKKIENLPGRAFAQLFSPGIITVDQKINPQIDLELKRLSEFGLTKQFPTMVESYIAKTQTHPRVELTPEEKTEYQKRVGKLTETSFNKTLTSSEYRNAKADKKKGKSVDDVKSDILAEAISDAKAQAKKEILKKKGLK
jgi:hypothetical protein